MNLHSNYSLGSGQPRIATKIEIPIFAHERENTDPASGNCQLRTILSRSLPPTGFTGRADPVRDFCFPELTSGITYAPHPIGATSGLGSLGLGNVIAIRNCLLFVIHLSRLLFVIHLSCLLFVIHLSCLLFVIHLSTPLTIEQVLFPSSLAKETENDTNGLRSSKISSWIL